MPILESDLFVWVILPLIIFLLRILDVSIGTLRIIFVSKGNRYIAPVLGFFEVLIWLFAIGQVMQNLNNIICFIAYAGGFSAGTFVGIFIEEKLAMGLYSIRLFLPASYNAEKIKERLSQAGFGVTSIKGHGVKDEMSILFSIFRRKDRRKILEIVEDEGENIFYTLEEMKSVNHGIFPSSTSMNRGLFRSLKGKK